VSTTARLTHFTDLVLVRFAAVGVVNTVIDLGLFGLFQPHVGITVANIISTTAALTFSFLVNGRFTFRTQRPTLQQAGRFLATTGVVVYVLQPLMIHGFLALGRHLRVGDGQVLLAKLAAICVVLVLNFASYRFVVWPAARTSTDLPTR
jgi:putative flippase GtrA